MSAEGQSQAFSRFGTWRRLSYFRTQTEAVFSYYGKYTVWIWSAHVHMRTAVYGWLHANKRSRSGHKSSQSICKKYNWDMWHMIMGRFGIKIR